MYTVSPHAHLEQCFLHICNLVRDQDKILFVCVYVWACARTHYQVSSDLGLSRYNVPRNGLRVPLDGDLVLYSLPRPAQMPYQITPSATYIPGDLDWSFSQEAKWYSDD